MPAALCLAEDIWDCRRLGERLGQNTSPSDQETLSVRSRRFRFLSNRCEHDQVIAVHSAGLTRVICEDCGHISFRFDDVVDPALMSAGATTAPLEP
jgi:ribosomal protein S27E